MTKIDKKLKNLTKNFGFKKDELSEIQKMYSGEFFDPTNKAYLKLLEISKDLCTKYNSIDKNLKQKLSLLSAIKIYFKKKKILNKLFPTHKFVGSIRHVDTVIGLVDLDSFVFLNSGTTFSPLTLTHIQKSTMFGVKVSVGDDNIQKNGNLIKLGQVDIGKQTWIGAGAKICNNTFVGDCSVVASGARVEQDISPNFLCLGRPAKEYCKLDKTYSPKPKIYQKYSDAQKQKIFDTLKKLGYKSVWKEYKKVLYGQKFNTCKIKFGNLFLLTHRLCSEMSNPQTTKQRRQQIVDILFPNHGTNFVVEDNVFLDLLGTVVCGNNVTIKSGTYLAGNIFLGNDVTLEQNSLIFASEHDMLASDRKMRFNLKNGLYRWTWTDTVVVEYGVTVGQNAIVVPSSHVTQNVPNGALYTNKKIIE